MTSHESTTTGERRDTTREPIDSVVEVIWTAPSLRGSGQNISEDGVYFAVDGPIRVRVRVDGAEVAGELVRVQSLDGARTGVAVRFSGS